MKTLYKFALLFLLASPGWCAVSVVQSTTAFDSGSSLTMALSYNSAPATGDILVAAFDYFPNSTLTPPSGWTVIDSSFQVVNGAVISFEDLYHIVLSTDTNSYTFTQTGFNEIAACAFDISGQSSSVFIDTHSIINSSIASTPPSITAPAVIPSVIGDLGISFYGAYIDQTPTSPSSGWTTNVTLNANTFYGSYAASKNSLTSDTTTPISNTWSVGANTDAPASAIVLISPPVLVSPQIFIQGGSINLKGNVTVK